MSTPQQVNNILSPLVVLAQATTVVLVFSLLAPKVKESKKILMFFKDKTYLISFFVALTSMVGSLFYSEVAGYEPCKLCWYQRILMYPLAFLFGFALLKKRRDLTDYALVLSSLGTFLAGYHYLLQIGVVPTIGCSAIGYSVSCAQRFVMTYGYITIPMMAFAGFALITVLLFVSKVTSKEKKKS